MNIHPDPLFFFAFLGCVIFLLGIAKIIIDIIQSLRRKPPIETEFATKAELAKLESEVRSMRSEMRANNDHINFNDEKLRLEIKEDIKGVHKRIDDVLRAVGRLEGKL